MRPKETFTERFNHVTSGLTDTKVGAIMGVTEASIRKIRRGDTQTIELHRALWLCRELNVSPWYLGGEKEPTSQGFVSVGASATIIRPDEPEPVEQLPRQEVTLPDVYHDLREWIEGELQDIRAEIALRPSPETLHTTAHVAHDALELAVALRKQLGKPRSRRASNGNGPS